MEERRRGPRRLLVHVAHTWMPLPVGEWVIGRAPEADIRIDDDRVSRRHGVVRALPDGWELTDGGSLNGIWVEGRQVQRMVVPQAGLVGAVRRQGRRARPPAARTGRLRHPSPRLPPGTTRDGGRRAGARDVAGRCHVPRGDAGMERVVGLVRERYCAAGAGRAVGGAGGAGAGCAR